MSKVDQPSPDELKAGILGACRPTNARTLVEARGTLLAMPRAWVLENVERVARDTLDLSDEWDYRRLLELSHLLDAALLTRLVRQGLDHDDPGVREAAGDFSG